MERGRVPLVWIAPLVGLLGFLALRSLPASSFPLAGAIIVQFALVTWMVTGRLPVWARLLITVSATCMAIAALMRHGITAAALGFAMGGICHALVYGGLLTWFGLSLQPGQEPIITGFARQMRKTMPKEVLRYTRKVTVAWCGFFAGQLLASLSLLWMAPHSVWSAFVSVWNLPLVAVFALGEYFVRSCLFAREERTGFIATLSALRGIRLFPGHTS
jgi:uncharacterized membrane protein